MEQPYPWQGSVCMFDLASFKVLRQKGGDVVVFDQCRYNAPTTKPTQFLYDGARFGQLEAWCNHKAVKQADSAGREYYAAHPSAVQERSWNGSYKTKALAAYPLELNRWIAHLLFESLLQEDWHQWPS